MFEAFFLLWGYFEKKTKTCVTQLLPIQVLKKKKIKIMMSCLVVILKRNVNKFVNLYTNIHNTSLHYFKINIDHLLLHNLDKDMNHLVLYSNLDININHLLNSNLDIKTNLLCSSSLDIKTNYQYNNSNLDIIVNHINIHHQ